MKRWVAIAVVLAVAAAPALAEAKKIKHRGEIVDDPGTKVTLKLTKRGGEIRKVSRFEAVGVLTRCDAGDRRYAFTALDSTKVTRKGNFKERLRNPDGSVLRIKGTVKNRGRRVVGFISTSEFDGGSAGTCQTPKQRFKTEKV